MTTKTLADLMARGNYARFASMKQEGDFVEGVVESIEVRDRDPEAPDSRFKSGDLKSDLWIIVQTELDEGPTEKDGRSYADDGRRTIVVKTWGQPFTAFQQASRLADMLAGPEIGAAIRAEITGFDAPASKFMKPAKRWGFVFKKPVSAALASLMQDEDDF